MAKEILIGLGTTFLLTIVCFVTASLIGILTCAGFCSKNKVIRTAAKAYNGLVIKIPPLVMLMLFVAANLTGVFCGGVAFVQRGEPEFYANGYGTVDFGYGTLKYYDAYADVQLALKSNRIDGFIAYYQPANEMMRQAGSPEEYRLYDLNVDYEEWLAFYVSEKSVGQTGDIMLCDEFKTWIEEFKQTEKYADIVARSLATRYEPFVSKEVAVPENAERTLKIGYSPEWVLFAMMDANGEAYGPAVELIKHFAADMGYGADIYQCDYSACYIDLPADRMDMMLGGIIYAEDSVFPGIRVDNKVFPVNWMLVTRAETVVEGLELIE